MGLNFNTTSNKKGRMKKSNATTCHCTSSTQVLENCAKTNSIGSHKINLLTEKRWKRKDLMKMRKMETFDLHAL